MRAKLTSYPIKNRGSRAAAVVEFAVVLPLLLTVVFGIIEFGWIFNTTQTLNSAAREGCRTAVLTGATDSDIKAQVDKVMQAVGYKNYTSTLAHATVADPTEKVTVEYPYQSLVGNFFGLSNLTLRGAVTMRKEGM